MKKFSFIAVFAMLAGSVLLPLDDAAANTIHTIQDNYWGYNARGYGDVIGDESVFGVDRMEVVFDDVFMNVKIFTPFVEGDPGTYGFEYGDLFISTDGWNPYGSGNYADDYYVNGETWEYVFDTDAGNLYQLPDYSNNNIDISDSIVIAASNSSYVMRDGQEILYRGNGDLIDSSSSFDSSHKGDYLAYSIELAALGNLTHGEVIGLKWGATCANDTIEGSVPTPAPEPVTMLLVGTGLVGLASLRRKFGSS